jgi:hypothetical protein
MAEIIKIISIGDAKPVKGVWYDYFDDIFISVIPFKRRKHIRRKSVISSDKADNGTSEWHLKWQYEIIEKSYGMNHSGKKTYEISILVDEERHIIDSLVDEKIAIEFQHTLSVDLKEMNQRFFGHKKAGFIPYLVLDFTKFQYQDFLTQEEKLSEKLDKWLTSAYHKNNNLFIDLEDRTIRLSDNIAQKHIAFTQEEFVQKLLGLEDEMKVLKSEWRKILSDREKARKVAEKMAEERSAYYFQLEKEENRKEKFESPDYKYFRDCYRNKVILPYILEYAKDLFSCQTHGGKTEGNTYEKSYSFFSRERDFSIHYVNVSAIKTRTVSTYRGTRDKWSFTYLYAYVEVCINISDQSESYRFEIERGQTFKK